MPDDAGTLSTYATGELRYWLRHQQPFGGWLSFQYSGWYDETAIMLAAVLDAYRLTGDRGMARRALPALRKGWAWLHSAYASSVGNAFGRLDGSSTSWAKSMARQAARGRRAHHRYKVEGWPWRMLFSCTEAALMASSGRATSISVLRYSDIQNGLFGHG